MHAHECSSCKRRGGNLYRYGRRALCPVCFVRQAWHDRNRGASFVVYDGQVAVFPPDDESDVLFLTVEAWRWAMVQALGRRVSRALRLSVSLSDEVAAAFMRLHGGSLAG